MDVLNRDTGQTGPGNGPSDCSGRPGDRTADACTEVYSVSRNGDRHLGWTGYLKSGDDPGAETPFGPQ